MKAKVIERALALYKDVLPNQPVRLRPTRQLGCSFFAADVPKCVLCGEEHWHGAGADGDRVGYPRGHRAAHCLSQNDLPKRLRHRGAEWEALRGRGYVLVPEDT